LKDETSVDYKVSDEVSSKCQKESQIVRYFHTNGQLY